MAKSFATLGCVVRSGLALLAVAASTGPVLAGDHHHNTITYLAVQPAVVTGAPIAYTTVAAPTYTMLTVAPATIAYAPTAYSYAPVNYAPVNYAPVSYAPVNYAPVSYAPVNYAPTPSPAPAPAPGTQYQWKLVPVSAASPAAPPVAFSPAAGLKTITPEARETILKSMRSRRDALGSATTLNDLIDVGTAIVKSDINKSMTQALSADQTADVNTLAASVLAESPATPQTPTTPPVNPPTQPVMMQPVMIQMAPTYTVAPTAFYILQPVHKHHFSHDKY